MRKNGFWGRWCPILAVTALGVLALSLSLERATADTPASGGAAMSQSANGNGPGDYERRTIRIGPGLPADLRIPVLPPITVDYRNDEGTLLRLSGRAVSPGGRERSATGAVASVPTICRNDAQCNDCNPCTLDACATATCTGGGPKDGFECTIDDDCDGTCNGGVRNTQGCGNDLDCCGDAGIGGSIANGTCDFFTCTALTDFFCVNPVIPDVCKGGTKDRLACATGGDCPGGTCEPQFVAGSECDDGLECDGQETCGAGTCIAATSPLCTAPQVCVESTNACVAACTADADCETDGNVCTVDKCDLTTGTCFVDPNGLCGPGASCSVSAKHCEGNNAPCAVTNPDCLGQGACVAGDVLDCGDGRCCDGAGTCSKTKFADCSAPATWLPSDSACGQIGNTAVTDVCPIYGSGVAPAGTAIVEIGPITPPNNCAGNMIRVGDDYTVANAGVGTGFISVNMIRFVHSAQVSARMAVEFWDLADPNNPVFIEDTFVPLGVNTGVHGPLVRSIILDPPLVVPESGVLAVSIAANFSPIGAVSMVSTDAADVGTNDPTQMFVGTSLVTDFLGQCAGGSRDQLFCNRQNGSADCTGGGTCNDIPDVLSFELVADAAAPAPTGGCCNVGAGTCATQLSWVCKQQGNTFRGVGVNCAVCLAGTNDGTACDTNADCTGGGICTESVCNLDPTKPCLVDTDCVDPNDTCVSISQCTVQACCNDATGACSIVPGIGNTCPAGTTSLGFATSCSPDGCPQPGDPSGDNCLAAGLTTTLVPVPLPGDPLVSRTITGSNVPATFDDFTQGRCVDADGNVAAACDPVASFCFTNGVNNGTPCTTDADCASGDVCTADANSACAAGETCTRLCGSGIFNPAAGGTRDPGWWVSFSIDKFADVRIDNCLSNPLVRPAWAFLDQGCPCNNFLANAGVREPLGTGVGGLGGARGGPFCNATDNFWQTYRNLPPDTYYYPIFSAPVSDIAAPVVGGTGGTFQFHVTVQAAEVAACCLPQSMCVRADRTLDGIALDGTGTPIPCAADADCTNAGSTCEFCAEEVQPNCDLALGSWLSKPITPDTVCEGGDNNGLLNCVDDADCPGTGGFCRTVGTSFSCGILPDGSDSPCNTGACCMGAGACDDRLPQNAGPMDRVTCGTENGNFFGGAKCEFPTPPCPVCTIASIPGDCQEGNGGFIFQMDRNIGFGGRAVADDFVAVVTEIGQFCFSPCFIRIGPDGTGGTNNIGECAVLSRDGFDPPPDDYRVQFFEDANGFPGAELPSSPGPNAVAIAAKRAQGGNSRCWDYSVVFDPPIDGFVQGTRYWVAFSGAGDQLPPDGDGCRVYLLNSVDGNSFSLQEGDPFGDIAWSNQDNTLILSDFSFCIEGGLTAPPPVLGACCRCNGVCTDNVPWEDCITSFDFDDRSNPGAIVANHTGDGFFFANQECISVTCEDIGTSGGGCPGAPSGIPGEDCVNPVVLDLQSNVTDVETVETLCSTTDGRATFTAAHDCGITSFVNDKWFEFTSVAGDSVNPATINIDICGDSDFDVVMAVYSTGVPGPCPVGTASCEPDESLLLTNQCIDLECPVVKTGRPTFQAATSVGVCYLVRIGGDDDQGTMQLEVKNSAGCPDSLTPEDDMIVATGGAMVQSVKNRFLSFKISETRMKAVRVKFVDLWGPFSVFNGTSKWVDAPIDSSEAGGLDLLNSSPPTFKSAVLVDAPVFRDWSADGVVHVHDELIIPSRLLPGQSLEPAVYFIQAIDATCDLSSPTAEDGFSVPDSITTPQWGDIAELDAGQFVAPGAGVSVTDTLSVLAKFAGASNAPIKVRVEMLGPGAQGPSPIVNGKIDVSDLLAVLDAFSGGAYPFPPPPLLDSAPAGTRAVSSR